MNTVLLPAATSSTSATPKTGSSRSSSDSSAPDPTSDFAGILASQAAPQPHASKAEGPDTRNVQARNPADATAGGTSPQRQRLAAQDHDAAGASRRGRLTPDTVLTDGRSQDAEGAAPVQRQTQGAGLVAHADGQLPERFSQIIAAMARVNGAARPGGAQYSDGDRPAQTAQPIALPGQPAHGRGAHQTSKQNPLHAAGVHQHADAFRGVSRPGANADTRPDTTRDTLGTGMPARSADPIILAQADAQRSPAEHNLADALPHRIPTDSPGTAGIAPVAAFSLIPAPAQGGDITLITPGTIGQPLHTPQWAPELGRQFMSLIRPGENGNHIAELRLDPPELGPLRVTINLNDSVVQALFTSSHTAVRSAVENALPLLQQQLEQEGLSLGHASVDHDDGSPNPEMQQRGGQGVSGNPGQSSVTSPASPARQRAPDALVDTFA